MTSAPAVGLRLSARFYLGKVRDGHRPVFAEIINRGDEPAAGVGVQWVTWFDATPGKPSGTGPTVVTCRSSVDFGRFVGESPLPPGGRAVFALPVVFLRAVASESDALSPDQYGIVVAADGSEVYRLEGAKAANLIAHATG
jgi:hypothetical protein